MLGFVCGQNEGGRTPRDGENGVSRSGPSIKFFSMSSTELAGNSMNVDADRNGALGTSDIMKKYEIKE